MSLFATLGVVVCLVISLPGSALAVDGVIEINQASALAGGINADPNDAPGFPVTIASAGSYRLTGNLTLASPNETGIEIVAGADGATLDLNGFTIGCPTCVAAGSGHGVTAASSLLGLEVRNGTIAGVGGDGIRVLGRHTRVDGIRVLNVQGAGINMDARSSVTNCLVKGSGGHGITAGFSSLIAGNVSADNASSGIACDILCTITGNVTDFNGVAGIATGESIVERNTATFNGTSGIVNTSGLVRGNLSSENTGVGLTASTRSGYTDNVFVGNNGGNANPQVISGFEIGKNICGNDPNCP